MEQDNGSKPKIRPMREEDLDRVMELYDRAKKFMAEHGNPTQWPPSYPPRKQVAWDMQKGHMFVCTQDERIGAVFYYREGEDPTYRVIEGGKWIDDSPYGVVHRITSDGTIRGAGSFCLQWAWERCGNLRIDTHENNVVMQNLLKKNGFVYCGIIRLERGEERLAYQKLQKQ